MASLMDHKVSLLFPFSDCLQSRGSDAHFLLARRHISWCQGRKTELGKSVVMLEQENIHHLSGLVGVLVIAPKYLKPEAHAKKHYR